MICIDNILASLMYCNIDWKSPTNYMNNGYYTRIESTC